MDDKGDRCRASLSLGLPAPREVFVEHTDGLQISLDDGRTDELHAATLELLGDLLGERRGRLRLTRAPHDRLVDGHPLQRAWVQFEDPAKGFYAGVWESDPGTWRIRYTEVEYCRILSGRSRITAADGTVTEVGPGDEFVIPSGFEGTWQVLERTRKTFVIHEASP